MPRFHRPAFAAISILLPALAHAQTAAPRPLLLRPAAFDAAPGLATPLNVEYLDGVNTVEAPWPATIGWFFVRSPGFQENRSQDDAPRAAAGERSVSITPEHPGITIVGLDLPPRTVEWPADQLPPVPGVARPATDVPASGAVRVHLVESAKTIFHVGRDASESVATSKTGQAVEIRPLMDPTTTPVGADILLRVYIGGDAVKNASITATNTGAAQTQEIVLSPTGAGFFRVSAPGLWRLGFTQARPLEGNPDAKWTIYSATLTFETPGAPIPAPPPAPPAIPIQEPAR